jgi:hypothetical protein
MKRDKKHKNIDLGFSFFFFAKFTVSTVTNIR